MSEEFEPKDKILTNESIESSEEFEFEKNITRYGELDQARKGYEADGRQIHDILKSLIIDGPKDDENVYKSRFEKLKKFFEIDEKSLSGIEYEMAEAERLIGYGPNDSKIFDNCENDVMVRSAIFFHDRIDAIKQATNNEDVDADFVQSVIDYIRAIEHDENSFMSNRFDSVEDSQAYISSCQRRRSICHNNMINQINLLNDMARKYGKKPLLYRNIITNSATNDYKNNLQMHHDRVTAARYVSEIIQLGYEEKIPKTNIFEEI